MIHGEGSQQLKLSMLAVVAHLCGTAEFARDAVGLFTGLQQLASRRACGTQRLAVGVEQSAGKLEGRYRSGSPSKCSAEAERAHHVEAIRIVNRHALSSATGVKGSPESSDKEQGCAMLVQGTGLPALQRPNGQPQSGRAVGNIGEHPSALAAV